MKTITLRNLPRKVAGIVARKARKEGISLAKAVIRLLQEAAGIQRRRQEVLHHDLDSLAGSWTPHQAAAFEKTLREQRKIDPELWK